IHGDADVDTPPAHSQRVFDQLKGPKRLILVPGAPHNGSLRPEVWTEIERFVQGMIRFTYRSPTETVTVLPAGRSAAFSTMPSEHTHPPRGMSDVTVSGRPGTTRPVTRSAAVARDGNGSRTTNTSSLDAGAGSRPNFEEPATPSAIRATDRIHPVEPTPVDTMMPLDDWRSVC